MDRQGTDREALMAEKRKTRSSLKELVDGGAKKKHYRKAFYLTTEQIKRVRIKAATDGTDASTVIRNLIDSHL